MPFTFARFYNIQTRPRGGPQYVRCLCCASIRHNSPALSASTGVGGGRHPSGGVGEVKPGPRQTPSG
eukprot:scaffold257597_cov47-Prasinocladus_malaysianus.AAC.1